MKKRSLLTPALAVLAALSLSSCDTDSLVAFFHYGGLSIFYVGDDVDHPKDPGGGGGGGGGDGGNGGGPGAPDAALNSGVTKTLATYANDDYSVRKFEERASGKVFFTITDREGEVVHERIREYRFESAMPDLYLEMERSLVLGTPAT